MIHPLWTSRKESNPQRPHVLRANTKRNFLESSPRRESKTIRELHCNPTDKTQKD